jgi:hypothetical protein
MQCTKVKMQTHTDLSEMPETKDIATQTAAIIGAIHTRL